MSLISEALKKARQEAARQDAQRSKSPYAVGVANAAERRTGLVAVLAGVGAGCLVAAVILAVAWSAGWGPFARSAKPAAQVAESAPAAPPAPVKPASEPATMPPAMIEEQAPPKPVQSARPEPQPVVEVRPSAPADSPAARPAPAPPVSAPAGETAPAPSAPVPAAPAPPAPVRPAAGAGGLVDGQTYAGEVPIPGGGTVRLNGIVFSQQQPVAMLDGRVMAPGEIIQGFTIAAIEAGRVKLQGYGATVFVSPK